MTRRTSSATARPTCSSRIWRTRTGSCCATRPSSKLQQAIALANANAFNTPASWTNGVSYTNVQIAQIANTMAAMTLAYYPRDSTELAAVAWATVEGFASKGMSSGTPVDFMLVQDGYASWISELMYWFDGIDAGRLHTRVAHFLDPATQVDPWPLSGNPQPNSPDKRLGDGTFGNAANVASFGTKVKPAKAGTDFAWSSQAILRPSRGSYHQSNIAQIRYDFSGVQDPQGTYGGYGPAPVRSWATLNDLLWAEALLRQGSANAAPAVRSDRQDTRHPRRSAVVGAQRGGRHDRRRPVHVQRQAGLDGRNVLAVVGPAL